ncbi:Flp pilus assembly protein TadB [Marmoricola sp. URHA0025 HA25]
MTAAALLGSTAAAAAVALLLAPSPRRPVARKAPEASLDSDRAVLLRLRPLLAGLAFTGAWVFVGGQVGIVAAVAAAVFAWKVLGRSESPVLRRRREELARDLPVAVHLIGACLDAGAATTGALDAVAAALPGAVADELRLVRHRLALGVDPLAVWRALDEHPQLRPLGRAMTRAHRSGASVRDAITGLATELAAESHARTEVLARSVEVRAAAPLGICFLPAFLVLGVVPMVVGVFSTMRLFE